MNTYHGCLLKVEEFFTWLEKQITKVDKETPYYNLARHLLKDELEDEEMKRLNEKPIELLIDILWSDDRKQLVKPMDLNWIMPGLKENKLYVWLVDGKKYILVGNEMPMTSRSRLCKFSEWLGQLSIMTEETDADLIEVGLSDFPFDTYYFHIMITLPDEKPYFTSLCTQIKRELEEEKTQLI